eukprot:188235-Amphidinium_carterae.1
MTHTATQKGSAWCWFGICSDEKLCQPAGAASVSPAGALSLSQLQARPISNREPAAAWPSCGLDCAACSETGGGHICHH